MKKYLVKSALEHNNVRKEEGETVELDDTAAERLLELGVVVPDESKKAKKADKTDGDDK